MGKTSEIEQIAHVHRQARPWHRRHGYLQEFVAIKPETIWPIWAQTVGDRPEQGASSASFGASQVAAHEVVRARERTDEHWKRRRVVSIPPPAQRLQQSGRATKTRTAKTDWPLSGRFGDGLLGQLNLARDGGIRVQIQPRFVV